MVLLEGCVTSVAMAQTFAAVGAHRLELCVDLHLGGLTPPATLLREVVAVVSIPVFVMLRQHGGDDFTTHSSELAQLGRDLAVLRDAGAAGYVFGFLADGGIDWRAMAQLCRVADGAPVTFHRAFDRLQDQFLGLQQLIDAGIPRVLTAGNGAQAWSGRERLRELVELADARISVMAGGGVRADHWRELVACTGVPEIHGSVPFRVDPSDGCGSAIG